MGSLVGQKAANFAAPAAAVGDPMAAPEQVVSLADYRERWLVLCWYPADFTFVCPTDSLYSHRAWLNTPRSQNGIEGLRFPLLADKSGRIAREWGVYVEDDGIALRGLFLIDPAGIVQYAVTQNLATGRSVDETLRVLTALQTGELCGSDWEPGRETLGT